MPDEGEGRAQDGRADSAQQDRGRELEVLPRAPGDRSDEARHEEAPRQPAEASRLSQQDGIAEA